jgi:hypothetical protein
MLCSNCFAPIRSTNDATDEHPRFLLDTSVEESKKEVSPEELGRLALRESLYRKLLHQKGGLTETVVSTKMPVSRLLSKNRLSNNVDVVNQFKPDGATSGLK